MINEIQYKITIFEESYKEDNISLLITYAFSAFLKTIFVGSRMPRWKNLPELSSAPDFV